MQPKQPIAPKYLTGVLPDLMNCGRPQPGAVAHLEVYHDDDCRIWKGRACSCEPDTRLVLIDSKNSQ